MLAQGNDPEKIYVEDILPIKMNLGLEYMKKISVFHDIKIMFQTVFAVLKK